MNKINSISPGRITRIILLISIINFVASCDQNDEIEYATGNPSKLAGNWVVFEFPGASLENDYRSPYYMVTAIDPNNDSSLVLDNLYNANFRIKAGIKGDTGFVALKAPQLEVTGKGDYDIEHVTIDGYINDNFVLKHYVLYPLAVANFPNMSFTEENMTEVIFFRAGYYNKNFELIDSVMIMGYRMTGFENVAY